VSVEASRKEIERRTLDHELRSAVHAADGIDRSVRDLARNLARACEYVPFEHFPPDELGQALRIPYQQFDGATAVALLDASGRALAPPARSARGARLAPDREIVDLADLEVFGRNIPLERALLEGTAIGPTYRSSSGAPRLVVAHSFSVARGQRRWVLAVETSLAAFQVRLAAIAPGRAGIAYLVDARGEPVTRPGSARAGDPRGAGPHSVVRRGLAGRAATSGRYRDVVRRENFVGAFAPVSGLGGGVVIEQPSREAFAALRQMTSAALLWTLVAAGLAVLAGALLARAMTAPVRELSRAAAAVGRGDVGHRLEVRSRDEIGELAQAFNAMAADVQAKQEEITRWNRELAARVEERTSELRDARDQIVRSEKLAATAELAAGVAHELNNPLTAILGLGQVLVRTSTNGVREDLEEIVGQAERMRAVIRNFMRFARPSDTGGRRPVNLNRVLDDCLAVTREKLEQRRIEVRLEGAPDLLDIEGNPADLLLAVLHLVTNAIEAMPRGGALTLRTQTLDHAAVKVVIQDTGVGIAPDRLSRIFEPFYTEHSTGSDRGGGGLGLPVAQRIAQEHQGRISVASTPGEGTTFTLFFPGLRRELHLR
jgi:signal transduction histidine kinase